MSTPSYAGGKLACPMATAYGARFIEMMWEELARKIEADPDMEDRLENGDLEALEQAKTLTRLAILISICDGARGRQLQPMPETEEPLTLELQVPTPNPHPVLLQARALVVEWNAAPRERRREMMGWATEGRD